MAKWLHLSRDGLFFFKSCHEAVVGTVMHHGALRPIFLAFSLTVAALG